MAYNFKDVSELRDLLTAVFATADGHDHDGTNSKAVTTATPTAGSVDKDVLAAGALAADATGRAVMATNYFDAATVLLKIADGAFAADTATRALFGDGIWTNAKLAVDAKTHILNYPVEDLGAGADITDRILMSVPTGYAVTISSIGIIPMGSSAGVDDSNTVVITIKNDAATIVAKTYDTDPQPPASGAYGDLGALSNAAVAAGSKIGLTVAQGSTANLPAFMLQIVYSIASA